MKHIVIIFFVFISFSCITSRDASSNKPRITLFSIPSASQNDTTKNNVYEVKILYNKITNGLLEFSYSVKNKTLDTVKISPKSFRTIPIFYNIDSVNEKQPKILESIDPEQKIDQLNQQKEQLYKEENPYSLNKKSVGTIVVKSLITGTIAAIFGQKVEDIETKRREDEDAWEEKHTDTIVNIVRQITFWKKHVPSQTYLSPNNNVEGTIFFPIINNANEIEVELTVKNNRYNFIYKQVNCVDKPEYRN